MKRVAALALALAACGHASPPPPKPVPLTIPAIPPPAPPPPPAPVHACTATAAAGRYLSVRGRYAVGTNAQIEARCDRLSVWTQSGGTRLIDPNTGVMTSRVSGESDFVQDELLSTGAIGLWTEKTISAFDRIDLETRWSVLRPSRHGRVFIAGRRIIEESGEACSPTCAVIAHDAASGAEHWRRPCPCDVLREKHMRAPELYEEMAEVDGRILAMQNQSGVEAWDAADGHTVWERVHPAVAERGVIVGKFIVLDRAPPLEVALMSSDGAELMRIVGVQGRIEAMAADGDTFFLSSSDVSEYGGIATVSIESIDLKTRRRVVLSTLKFTARRYASNLPQLWAPPGGPLFYYEVDNGLLMTIDRANGQVRSSIGIAGRKVIRTMTGFATIDDEGVVEILEPSDVESPPTETVKVEGKFVLDGKPLENIEIVVGNVVTKTKAGGRYSATLHTRGRFFVKAKQPTSQQSIAYWVGADQVVQTDGRDGNYVVDLDAKRDFME